MSSYNCTTTPRYFTDELSVVNGAQLRELYYDSLPSYNTTLTEQLLRDFVIQLEQFNMQGSRNYTLLTSSAGYDLFQQSMLNEGLRIVTTPNFDNLEYSYTYNVVPTKGAYITEDKLYFNGKVYAESKDPGRLLDLKKRLERINHG